MEGHFFISDFDSVLPGSFSPENIGEIIRGHEYIGFDGFLVSDDIDMKGMIQAGKEFESVENRAIQALKAGTDAVLYCSGILEDMKKLARVLPPLRKESLERLDQCQIPQQHQAISAP